jgi:hypothetical protein
MTFEIGAAGGQMPLRAIAEFVTELLKLSVSAAIAITVTLLLDAAY